MQINKFPLNAINKIESFSTSFWGVVVLLTITLYYQFAFVPGFFHDGYLYAAFGKTVSETNNFWVTYISQDMPDQVPHHPPLIFMLEGIFFKIFGNSYQSIRIFFGLFIFLSLYFLFLMFKEEKKITWGKLSLLMFILLPPLFKKTRSPNLDIPLMTFILGSVSFYFLSYKNNFKKIYWFLSGTLFGLALLTKGLPALAVPLILFMHLLLSGKIKHLVNSFIPWISLVWGLFLGALWPIVLHLQGRDDVFDNYLKGQFFGTVIEGRGNEGFNFWVYPQYLLENVGPWFLLSLVGIYFILNKKFKNDLSLLFCIFYFAILAPFSFVKWKYSNYIVPMFPMIATISAIPLIPFFEKHEKKIQHILTFITILLILALSIFPLTNKIKRDTELFKIKDSIETLSLENKTKNWVLVNDVYPFHNLYNFIGFNRLGQLYHINDFSSEKFKIKINKLGNAFVILPLNIYELNKKMFKESQIIALFQNKNIIAIYIEI